MFGFAVLVRAVPVLAARALAADSLLSTSVIFDFATVVVLPLSATEAASLPPGLALVLIDVETLPEVEDWIAPFTRGAGLAAAEISAVLLGWAFPVFAGTAAFPPACPTWLRPLASFAVPAAVFPPPVPRAEAVRDAESETGLALEPAFAEVFTFTMGTLTPPRDGKKDLQSKPVILARQPGPV
ncbi:hypothetical protein ACQUJZ_00060 [Ralstonia pseudosolanacearum]|uniref:hypothetical protein n=1 Tax=Ralstonia pseudosolanacearum TaxID=1310165 RepID=UPI001E4AC38C|nr:hypothetical protein [Ralstonia pseudosolanacearum]MDO3514349.1 hypothetical protein [Ralstonia pseudosolanacearum]MDO3535667.1 hypothetical protein [Ralstonia pseudosolanacearum]MDO3556257.1 hypothetical protein [Ralstonia pseudosolanacearum]MDO3604862.1 hypothetical protein [Ralstonia pseudosolanacearum]